MELKDYESMYHSLKRLHDATNDAVIKLQRENSELKDEIILLNNKLINCQSALDINKDIMRNALTNQNEIKDSYVNEIRELRDKIKVIEG